MKSFTSYLTEAAAKKYEFKIKLAGIELTSETQDRLEHALKAYDLDSISKPKHLPVQDRNLDFPSLGNVDVYLINVVLNYPCTDEQLRQTISEQGRINLASIVVIPAGQPEEQRRDSEEEADDGKDKKALLDTPELGGESDAKNAGQEHADSMLKDIETRKYEVEGEATPDAKTTNELPQNNESPFTSELRKAKK